MSISRCLWRSVFAIVCVILAVGRADIIKAEEIVVLAPHGVAGEIGALGQNGGVGGDGTDAVVEATGDAANHAEARAGRGGVGGRGGMAPDIGFSAGAGGAGGLGADARATVSTVGDTSDMEANALAFGGQGGAGATAGSEFGSALRQESGDGGHGGDAEATGYLISTGIDVLSGSLDSTVLARGGSGGRSPSTVGPSGSGELGGNGGNAVARLTLIGNGEDISANISASGGSGGDGAEQAGRGDGGSANSRVTIEQRGGRGSIDLRSGAHTGSAGSFGMAGSARSSVDIQNDGFEGTRVYDGVSVGRSSSAHDGADASSTIRAINTSTGYVEIETRATAGAGRFGGEATARTHGEAFGAFAGVTATQIHGASIGQDDFGNGLSGRAGIMTDAVTGRANNIRLTQEARAGSGATAARSGGSGGTGGEARTSLHRLEEGDQEIEIATTSVAGQGGVAFGAGFQGGRGGSAWVEGIVEEATGPVVVGVTATAGRGGGGRNGAEAGNGGDVSFGRVFGSSSNGSSVSVGAAANGGSGGEVRGFYDSMGTVGGDGTDVEMVDLVDGRTAGAISLGQGVVGGFGGSGDLKGGDGGTAFNSITRTFDSESVFVIVGAGGGHGGAATNGDNGDGGQAISKLQIISTGGDLRLGARAKSGNGHTTEEARVDIYGRTDGDSHSIEIDSHFARATAQGGDSVYGGDARGRFIGEATGNSRVLVAGRALGGGGALDGLVASDGHDAVAYAEGSNAGDASVEVRSYAIGGDGMDTDRREQGRAGDGGSAQATAYGRSTGGGRVTVHATQIGGRAGSGSARFDANGHPALSVMVNAVSGATTGKLTLEQVSIGGLTYRDVNGGDAHSSLSANNSGGGEVEATSEAVGGIGGGVASAHVATIEYHGSATIARALATGGVGGLNGQAGGTAAAKAKGVSAAGADVQVIATATGGEGLGLAAGGDVDLLNAVSGSTAGVLTLEQSAIGGDSGLATDAEIGPRGGAAVSRVETENIGGGDLRLHSLAQGGRATLGTRSAAGPGGSAISLARGRGVGSGHIFVSDVARGGDSGSLAGRAASRAEGRSASLSGVEVHSEAVGGAAILRGGVAGDAYSTAIGVATLGPALVFASASGGDHLRDRRLTKAAAVVRNTRSHASAIAVGMESAADSFAEGRTGFVGAPELQVSAIASARGDGELFSEASVGIAARLALESTMQSAAAIEGVHQREGEWTRIGLQVNAEESGPDIMLRAEALLQIDTRVSNLAGLHVSFLDLEQTGADFSDLSFRIEDRTTLLLDREFSSSHDAQAFFQSTIDLGGLHPDYSSYGLQLRFILEGLTGVGTGRVGTYFAIGTIVVPEPGTAVLLSLGLLWFSAGRHTLDVRRSRAGRRYLGVPLGPVSSLPGNTSD